MKKKIIGFTCLGIIVIVAIAIVNILSVSKNGKDKGNYKIAADYRVDDLTNVSLTAEEKANVKKLLSEVYRHNDRQAGFIADYNNYYYLDVYADSRAYALAMIVGDEYSCNKLRDYYSYFGTKGYSWDLTDIYYVPSVMCFFKDVNADFEEEEYVELLEKNANSIKTNDIAELLRWYDKDEVMKKFDVHSCLDEFLKDPYNNDAIDVMNSIVAASGLEILDQYDMPMLTAWFDSLNKSKMDVDYVGCVNYCLTGDKSILVDYYDELCSDDHLHDSIDSIDSLEIQLLYHKINDMRIIGYKNEVFDDYVRRAVRVYVDSIDPDIYFKCTNLWEGVCLSDCVGFEYDREKLMAECRKIMASYEKLYFPGEVYYLLRLYERFGMLDEIPDDVKKDICSRAAVLTEDMPLYVISEYLDMRYILSGDVTISEEEHAMIFEKLKQNEGDEGIWHWEEIALANMTGYKLPDDYVTYMSEELTGTAPSDISIENEKSPYSAYPKCIVLSLLGGDR